MAVIALVNSNENSTAKRTPRLPKNKNETHSMTRDIVRSLQNSHCECGLGTDKELEEDPV